jgi:hypothetical protein
LDSVTSQLAILFLINRAVRHLLAIVTDGAKDGGCEMDLSLRLS